MQRLRNLLDRFKKKENEVEIPEEWVKQKDVKQGDILEAPVKHKIVKVKRFSFRRPRRIRLRFLRGFKRIMAGFLFIIHGFATFVASSNPLIAGFFLFTSFILLDYLWKTKSPKIDWGGPQK